MLGFLLVFIVVTSSVCHADKFVKLAGLKGEECVSKVKNALLPFYDQVKVSLSPPALEFSSDVEVDESLINKVLSPFGYAVVVESDLYHYGIKYKPLIFSVLSSAALAQGTNFVRSMFIQTQVFTPTLQLMRFSTDFMGWMLMILASFKLTNLPTFKSVFARYDPIALRVPAFAEVYPFLELSLGVGYLVLTGLSKSFRLVNIATSMVMFITSLGIWDSLRKKERLTCGSMGGRFNLPLSKVSLFENLSMSAMALFHAIVG
jgi:hypothetical protein